MHHHNTWLGFADLAKRGMSVLWPQHATCPLIRNSRVFEAVLKLHDLEPIPERITRQ